MIVDDDKMIIFRHGQVLFKVIRALSKGKRFGFQRVFRDIARCAAMRDDDFV